MQLRYGGSRPGTSQQDNLGVKGLMPLHPTGWPRPGEAKGQGGSIEVSGGQQALAAPAPQHHPPACRGPHPFLWEVPNAGGFPLQELTQEPLCWEQCLCSVQLLIPAWISGPFHLSVLHVNFYMSESHGQRIPPDFSFLHIPTVHHFQYEIKEKRGGGSRRAVAGKKYLTNSNSSPTPL